MSWNENLYVKGMDEDSFRESEEDENVWDDRNLINAYDKAMKIANLEVAKRIAMSTNAQTEKESKQKIAKGQKKQQPQKKVKKLKWTVGMPCKALYDEDGLEYEARIISIVNDRECIIQFSGYDNLQKVELSSLLPVSQDESNKKNQMKVDDFESQSSYYDDVETKAETAHIDSVNSHFENERSPSKKKKSGNNSFTLPDIPMPDLAMIKNLGGMDLPFPPPPPELGAVENEQQAVSSMLLSWYMSGYYTGLYQGMKRAREDGRK